MASIALGLTCLGCLLLSLSLRRHYRRAFGDESRHEGRLWPLRLAGYALLLLALWPSIRLAGLWVGIILWLSVLALAAFLQIMLLTYQPRYSGAFCGLGVALIVLGLAW